MYLKRLEVEEIGDKRLYITKERERDRETERQCVHACVFYYSTKLWTQFYISGLLGNRDGSHQSAHLRNLIRHSSFFAYHLRWTYIRDTHWITENTNKKNTQQPHAAGYYNAEISLHKAIV